MLSDLKAAVLHNLTITLYARGVIQKALTTGAENWCFECETVHPPGQHTDPEPCLCQYRLFTTSVALTMGYGAHRSRFEVVLGSYFTIHKACQHHGELNRVYPPRPDLPWDRPWETTLGPDETQP